MRIQIRPMLLSLVLGAVSVLALPSAAQTRDGAATPDQILADEIARLALSTLTLPQAEETDHPQRMAAILLARSSELDPDNAQVWKLRVELAREMDDAEATEAALVGYLSTGAADDRAQLDLITLRLSRANTLDERYRSLEQLLDGQRGREMSDPLRSRLATQAAALAAELVDPRAQARWVVEAARLDPANAEAAQMLYELVVERGGDSLRQGTALINIVRAEPLKPWARTELAALLAQEAAFVRAAQQFNVIDNWYAAQPVVIGQTVFRSLMPMSAYHTWGMCLATIGHDALTLQAIEAIEQYLTVYHEVLETAIAEGVDVSQAPVMPRTLPIELELVRLAVLDGESDAEAASAAFERIEAALAVSVDTEPGESDTEAGGENEGEAAGQSEHAQAELEASAQTLALIAAVFGPDADKAQTLIDRLDEGSDDRRLAQGYLAVRAGEADAARELLEPLAGDEPLAACGLAIIADPELGDQTRTLQDIIRAAPGSFAALAAGRHLSSLDTEPLPTRNGQGLIDHMTRFPEAIWAMDIDRSPWLDVRVKIDPARFHLLDEVVAQVTIWNTTRFPIAIGDDSFLHPRALLITTPTINGQPLGNLGPVIVDLSPSLTLGPGERLMIDTRMDLHSLGALRFLNPGSGILFDTRLIVNPAIGPAGTFIPSATGGTSTARDCIIQGTPPSDQAIEQWLTDMGSSDTATRMTAQARLAGLSRDLYPEVVTREVEQRLSREVMAALPQMSEIEQAWTILHMREAELPGATFFAVSDYVKESDSELIWLCFLGRQVVEPGSAMISEAIGRQDMPTVSAFAQQRRSALRQVEAAQAEFDRRRQEEEERRRREQGRP